MSQNNFSVAPEIFEDFPGMRLVVAVTSGVANQAPAAELAALWRDAWETCATLGIDDARRHPNVADFRTCFRELGVSMKRFPTSIEAMLRRALKGGEPFSINPLVDFYNALSLTHICPAGAFDLGALSAPIELRRTRAGDSFQALDAEEIIEVPAGETAYVSGTTVLTRHFMWRQSRAALVSADTADVFLVSEIPGVAGLDVAVAMRDSMTAGLQRYFGCDCTSFIMSAGDERISW